MGCRKAYDLGQLGELDEIEALHQRMSDILLSANHEDQLALINAHRTWPARPPSGRADRIQHQ